jgi:hypothetical protein
MERKQKLAELAALVGDDGTGDLGVIVDNASSDDTIEDLGGDRAASAPRCSQGVRLCATNSRRVRDRGTGIRACPMGGGCS